MKVLVEASPLYGNDIAIKYASSLSNFGKNELTFVDFSMGDSSKDFYLHNSYDVVLLTGGIDINPELYGETAGKGQYYSVARDKFCEQLVDRYKRIVPIIGICRGLQYLWVHSGRKLIQHLDPAHSAFHTCYLSSYWRVNKKRQIYINSMHHQALSLKDGIPDGWEIVGTAPDGVPEAAINLTDKMGGVQYHPEELLAEHDGRKLFDKIVKTLIKS